MGITRIAVKRPISALMVLLAILVFGIGSLFGFSMELLPEAEQPVLMVHTAFEGADPETVDETVSKLIEETAETLNGIHSIETYSYENSSMVMLRYEYGTEPMSNYLKLQNALAEAKLSFPAGTGEPVIIEMNMESEPSLQISAYAEEEKEVLAFLGEGMLAELENLPAVAKVDVYGGEMNYIRVELKQELLKHFGLDLGSVAEFMAASNFSVPIGTVEQGNQVLGVTSAAKRNSLQEIKEIPIRTENTGLIRLEDIADITWSVKDAESISRFNGEENVTISITKSQRADAMELSKQVNEVVEKYAASSEQVAFEVIYDGGDEIFSTIKTLAIALLIGGILAMAVILLLFGNWKTALATGASVTFSLLLTLIAMRLLGCSLNVITVGALIMAAGLLLDTAVNVMENYFRLKDELRSRKEAAVKCAKAMRGNVLTTVAATIGVCLPMAFMNGFSAKLFVPLGYVVVFAAVAAFLEAAFFLPMMFVWLNPEEKVSVKPIEKLRSGYEKAVRGLMKKKELVIGLSIFIFALSCAAVIFSEKELVAESDNGVVNVAVDFRYGMKTSEIEKKLIVLEELLMESEEVESYSTTVNGSSAEIRIWLSKDTTGEKFREMLKTKTEDYVGIDINVSNESNLSDFETPDGEEVVLSGYHLEGLQEAARELADRYREVPGVLAVLSSAETEGTKLEITIDSLKAMNYGLTAGEVAERLQEFSAGREVMKVQEEGRDYSVCLEYPEGMYGTPQNLMNANIETANGAVIPLSELAQLEYTDAQNCIVRRNGKYIITMTVTCPDRYRADVRAGMEKAWGKLKTTVDVMKEDSSIRQMTQEEFKMLYIVIGAAILLLFFVLTIRFESIKHAVTMLLSIPLGLFGAFFLVFVSGKPWNLVSLVGILFLIEMIVCNGLRYTERAEKMTGTMPLEDALVESGLELLRPMAVYALAMIAWILPIILWPGADTALMKGMTLVMVGGTISGTILILLLFPVFYQFLYEEEEVEEIGESVEE